jgi:CO dehydrogenase nickel-insertion accessory protein CooC1
LANIQQIVDDIINSSASVADAESTENLNETFKIKMVEFLKNSSDEVKEQEENFQKCKDKFKKVTGLFSMDFKVAWKREGQVFKKQE